MNAMRLSLPFPPTGNRVYRNATWMNAATWALDEQHVGVLAGPYSLRVTLGRRERSGNVWDHAKIIVDLLNTRCVVDGAPERIDIGWSDRVDVCRITLKTAKPLAQRRAAA